ncbi:Transcriptional regulator, MarR family [Desulfovibrio sp. DV]|uniref:MarR family winged helix-turn-helix transcriptional regulator n=1 Tax=Desulfovibrio sp. DV TaxID=1844708 RepID=UPI00094BB779|nr:MarR family winged helix-turn-helix transcriptional regulator [Desulfovibrio sp. DV]OLN26166.1 Transcriptional regulator, MarR family [Desulfovibrio sp. DV]
MPTDHVVSLISRVREKANALIVAQLERRGHPDLAPSHGAILATLYACGPVPMGVLAKSIDRKNNTLTVLVRKLESAGYVCRQAAPSDSRVALIALTPKGEGFRKDFQEISDTLLAAVWGTMEDTSKEALVAGLERVLANLG